MANKYVRLAVLAAVLVTALTVGIAWAVQLSANTVGTVGGTGLVTVYSGVESDQIDAIWFLINSDFDVDKVQIDWTADVSGTVLVGVVVYDNSDTAIATGSTTVSVTDGNAYNTVVTLSTAVDPSEIYKVEVVIVQQS